MEFMKFAVILANGRYRENDELRENIAKFMYHLNQTFIYPTDLIVLDGKDIHLGKTAVLNHCIQHLNLDIYDVYVTIDDDIKLPNDWQHQIARAFSVYTDYVAFGIDWAHTKEGSDYMMEVNKIEERDGIKVRPLNRQNIAGAFIATRPNIIKKVGINKNHSHVKYDFTEDGWRCGQYRKFGKIGYVVLEPNKPELLHYNDSEKYLNDKTIEINKVRTGKK